MGPLPFLSPADAPKRKKERGPRRGGGGSEERELWQATSPRVNKNVKACLSICSRAEYLHERMQRHEFHIFWKNMIFKKLMLQIYNFHQPNNTVITVLSRIVESKLSAMKRNLSRFQLPIPSTFTLHLHFHLEFGILVLEDV